MGFPEIGLKAVLDDANFKSGLNNYLRGVDQMMGKTSQAERGIGGQFTAMGRNVLGFGAMAATAAVSGVAGLTAGVAALGVASAKTAISFESAWTGVTKTTDGLVDDQGRITKAGQEMQVAFRELAKEIPRPVEELMAFGEIGGQLGVPKEALVDFSRVVAAMGDTTNLAGDQAADALAHIANIMGTTTREGNAGFEKLGNAIVATGNAFAGTEADIANFATRIAGAGQIVGLTEGDVIGISAAMANLGIEAEAGGTAVQKVLLEMNKQVVTGGDKLKDFAKVAGVSASEFATLWQRDAGQAFQLFVHGLGKAGNEGALVLQQLGLEDARLMRSFLSLGQAGNTLTDAMKLANSEFANGTALMDEANKRYGTTESQIQILKNNLRDLGITLGTALLPPLNQFLGVVLKNVVPVLSEFAQYLAKVITTGNLWGDHLSKLPGWLQPVAEGVGKVVLSIQSLLAGDIQGAFLTLGVPESVINGITALATTIGNFIQNQLIPFVVRHGPELKGAIAGIGAVLAGSAIAAAVAGIAGAIAALTSPIGLLIAAAGLLGAAWAGNWFGIRDVVGQVVGVVGPMISNFIASVRNWFDDHWPAIQRTFETVWNSIKTTVGSVIAFVMPLIQQWFGNLQAAFGNLGPVIGAFRELFVALGPVVTGVLQGIGAAAVVFFGLVTTQFSGILRAMGPFLAGMTSLLTGVVRVLAGVVNTITGFVELLVGIFTGNTQKITDAFGRMGLGLTQIAQGFRTAIVDTVGQMVEAVLGYFQGLWEGATRFFAFLRGDSVAETEGMASDVTGSFSRLKNEATGQTEGMKNGVTSILDAMRGAAGQTSSGMADDWTRHWSNMQGTARSGVDSIHTTTRGGFGSMRTDAVAEFGAMAAQTSQAMQGMNETIARLTQEQVSESVRHYSNMQRDTTSQFTTLRSNSTAEMQRMLEQISATTTDLSSNLSRINSTMVSESVRHYQGLSAQTNQTFTSMTGQVSTTMGNFGADMTRRTDQLKNEMNLRTEQLRAQTVQTYSNMNVESAAQMEAMKVAMLQKEAALRQQMLTNQLQMQAAWLQVWADIHVRTAQVVQAMVNAVFNLMSQMVNQTFERIQAIQGIISSGMTYALGIWNGIWNAFPGSVAGAMGSVISIVQGAVGAVNNLVSQINSAVSSAISAAQNAARSVGSAITSGVAAGSSSQNSQRQVQTAVRQTASQTTGYWQHYMGIRSPSKVMAKIGEQLNAGLAIGMVRSGAVVERTVRQMVAMAVAEARGGAVNLYGGVAGGGNTYITNISRPIHLTMNPQYANYQSPASVYFDAQAALASARY